VHKTADSGKANLSLATSRIVIVDDVELNNTLLRRMLVSAGWNRVDAFTDPKAGLESCLVSPPDLLLLDLHMPQMDGYAFLEQLHDRLAHDVFLPIIVISADVTTKTKRRVLAAGAKDFLTKPLDRFEVVFRVRNTLETAQFYKSVSERNSLLQGFIEDRTISEREEGVRTREQQERVEQVLVNDALSIVFQPICELGSNRIVGFEALSRFTEETPRSPDRWFADAAEVGLGAELELLAVSKALDFLQYLPTKAFMSVNASPAVTMEQKFISLCSVDPRRVVVELTEHNPVDDYPAIIENLKRFRSLGIRVAVDDTGAGFAGLEFLVRLRPDVIKLDRTLVAGIDSDPAKRAMAAALVLFARDIGATVIGEGIERNDELETLRELGCKWGQGFLLGRPSTLSSSPWPEQWSISND
jgi:EAL domain-containing protein (putative c-di-GMP-specific phosphodiesterase class I)/DNA-binding response OmpR family regulator